MYMYDGVDLVATRFCRIENRTNSDERALLFSFLSLFFPFPTSRLHMPMLH